MEQQAKGEEPAEEATPAPAAAADPFELSLEEDVPEEPEDPGENDDGTPQPGMGMIG